MRSPTTSFALLSHSLSYKRTVQYFYMTIVSIVIIHHKSFNTNFHNTIAKTNIIIYTDACRWLSVLKKMNENKSENLV